MLGSISYYVESEYTYIPEVNVPTLSALGFSNASCDVGTETIPPVLILPAVAIRPRVSQSERRYNMRHL